MTAEHSAVALLMARDMTERGARPERESECILALLAAGWRPQIIDDLLDEARENAAAGRGVEILRRAA
jgi:hypothetical protein